MEIIDTAYLTSLWLGILTSISPCPLAANIAAVSYIGTHVENPRRALWTGLLYLAGRVATYVMVCLIVTLGTLSIPGLSNFLQKYMNNLLGPLFILVGVVLSGWIPLRLPSLAASEGLQARVARGSFWGAFVLGVICALAFCPISAALFFGSLIPLAVQHQSYVLLPSLYGIGSGLPVLAVGLTIMLGTRSIGTLFSAVTKIERFARIITALIFFVVGIYMILRYQFYLF